MRFIRIGADVIAAAVALIVLVAIVLVRDNTSAVATDTFSSTDYQTGGYAAWYALLDREGVVLERFEQRAVELDRGIDTLISAAPVVPVIARGDVETAALDAWVRAGGRLIRAGDAATKESTARPGALTGTFAGVVRSLARAGTTRLRSARLGRGEHAEVLLADGRGLIAVRETHGRGEIIRVSDAHLFANGAIAQADNARFAYLLARERRPGAVVAFDEAIHGALVDRTWWALLNVPLRIVLVAFVLAVLVAIAGGALRLGPAVDARGPREPASGEFIAAVAGLYERTHLRAHAIEVLTGKASSARPTDRDLIAAAVGAHSERMEKR